MSRLSLDVSCPKCESEEIYGFYDENQNNIICYCIKCDFKDSLDKFSYLIEENFIENF